MRKTMLIFTQIIITNLFTPLPGQDLQVKFHHQIDISRLYPETASLMQGLSVSSENKIYLIDSGLNRVLLCDSAGILLKEVGGFGWEKEQFDQPRDIWAENSLDVFVADYNNSRIQRFDRNLNFVTAIIGEEIEPASDQFSFPVALAWANFGDLFIIETELNRIMQFDEQGNVTLTFGDFDEGAGQLEEPVALCISDDNEIFVADQQRKSIMKFDYYGNFLQAFEFQFLSNPVTIACLGKHIFLLDGQNNSITIAATNGALRFHFNPLPAAEKSSMQRITDLCTSKNRLYILNDTNRRIDVYTVTTDDQ